MSRCTYSMFGCLSIDNVMKVDNADFLGAFQSEELKPTEYPEDLKAFAKRRLYPDEFIAIKKRRKGEDESNVVYFGKVKNLQKESNVAYFGKVKNLQKESKLKNNQQSLVIGERSLIIWGTILGASIIFCVFSFVVLIRPDFIGDLYKDQIKDQIIAELGEIETETPYKPPVAQLPKEAGIGNSLLKHIGVGQGDYFARYDMEVDEEGRCFLDPRGRRGGWPKHLYVERNAEGYHVTLLKCDGEYAKWRIDEDRHITIDEDYIPVTSIVFGPDYKEHQKLMKETKPEQIPIED